MVYWLTRNYLTGPTKLCRHNHMVLKGGVGERNDHSHMDQDPYLQKCLNQYGGFKGYIYLTSHLKAQKLCLTDGTVWEAKVKLKWPRWPNVKKPVGISSNSISLSLPFGRSVWGLERRLLLAAGHGGDWGLSLRCRNTCLQTRTKYCRLAPRINVIFKIMNKRL